MLLNFGKLGNKIFLRESILKNISIIFFLFSFIINLHAASKTNKITAVIPKNFAPLHMVKDDGTITGFGVEVFNAIAKDANIEVEYIVKPSFKEAIKALKNKEADVFPSIWVTEKRKKDFLFTDSTDVSTVRAYKRKSSSNLLTLNDIKTKKVVVPDGTSRMRMMKEHPKDLLVVKQASNGESADEKAFISLISGESDVWIYTQQQFYYVNKQTNKFSSLEAFGDPLDEFPRAIAIQKDNPKLQEKLNLSLEKFKKTEKYIELYNYWLGGKNDETQLNDDEITFLQQNKQFQACYKNNSYPLTGFENGKITGISGEILQLIEKDLKVNFSPLIVNSDKELLENIQNGRCDIIPLIAQNSLPLQSITPSKTILKQKLIAIGNFELPFIDTLSQETSKTFYVRDANYKEMLNKQYKELNIVLEPDTDKIMESVKKDKNKILIVSSAIATNIIQMYGIDSYKVVDIFDAIDLDKAIGVNANNMTLLNVINKSLYKIDNTKIQEIVATYRITEYTIEKGFNKNLLWGLITLFIFALYLFVKNYENAKQRQKFQTIMDNASDGIFILDMQGNLIEYSKKAQEFLGYSDNEMQTLSVLDWDKGLSTPKDFTVLAEQATNIPEHFERVHTRKDKSTYDAAISSVKVILDGNQYIYASVRDVSEEKILKEQLHKAKLEADEANESKSRFLANMSHEIRTPMNGILGFLEQLAKTEKDSERIKKFNVINDSGKQLLNIINDILDFSKIESGKMDIDLHPCNFSHSLSNSLEIFQEIASKKNINLQYDIDKNLPECILADTTRLQQIKFNLLSNAIKFTANGGEVRLSVHYKENSIYFSVEDTGIGIPKDKLAHIFEAFAQEDKSTTRKFGGTGLGLSISSKLLKLMGSELKVESKVGKGSKFYFELPVEVCTQTLEGTKEIDQDNKDITLKAHTLIVEDNKTNQMLMSMILDDLNITYDLAADGVEAIEQFKKNKYDLIFMDENMPNMNGIEATKHIRNIENEQSLSAIPIIAVTANALSGDKEKFLNVGMDNYIPKPYTEEDIVKVLKKYL